MTLEEMKNLKSGDEVINTLGTVTYTVIANYGTRVTAIRIADLTNPGEWELVEKS